MKKGQANRKIYFITENSNIHKIKSLFFAICIFLLIGLIALLFSTIWSGAFEYLTKRGFFPNFGIDSIKNISLTNLFYAEFIGGLFFVPSADEFLFYYSLVKGNSILLSFILTIGGLMLAQLTNYLAGSKLGDLTMNLISKKRLYSTRRFMNKYGTFGIFLFNLFPLPSPLLTFALAVTHYSFKKLILWTLLGKIAKFGIIVVFFLFTANL